MQSKLMTMHDAVKAFVNDGDVIVIEGFTHLICFAAGHEIIRQKKKDLTACRLTPDLIYDQLVAAGCVRKIIFSWAGNPGVGPLYGLRRAVEQGIPREVAIEEYTHFGMVARFVAGASNMTFMHLDTFTGSTLIAKNPNIRKLKCPFSGKEYAAVPALNPDIAIIQVQRVDEEGNAQIWGLMGVQREAAFASKKVIIVAEELVDRSIIRSDPNRTIIPGMKVDAVVIEPFAAHPSYAQGYYDRDNRFYVAWHKISKDQITMERYINEWIYGVSDRREYMDKLGFETLDKLKVGQKLASAVNYGY